MAPGMFSYSSNGAGLGDTKTFFRGFKDGQYNIMFDGIPFNDTNDPTHHSWAFFPSSFSAAPCSTAVRDRPTSIGPDDVRRLGELACRATSTPIRMPR